MKKNNRENKIKALILQLTNKTNSIILALKLV